MFIFASSNNFYIGDLNDVATYDLTNYNWILTTSSGALPYRHNYHTAIVYANFSYIFAGKYIHHHLHNLLYNPLIEFLYPLLL